MAFIKEKVLENNIELFEPFNLTYDGKKERQHRTMRSKLAFKLKAPKLAEALLNSVRKAH